MKDYYQILGIEQDASDTVVKKAYRKLALQHHPDKNSGDPQAQERFKDITEAYTVLSDPKQRAAYDGRGAFSGVSQDGSFSVNIGGFGDIFEQFDGIFGDFMGGRRGRGRQKPKQNPNIGAELILSFEEVVLGCTREIIYERHLGCNTCGGDGCKPGTTPRICTQCKGSGKINRQQGFFQMVSGCPTCGGAGKFVHDICLVCAGEGLIIETEKCSVDIPPGLNNGDRVRLKSRGEQLYLSSPPGDLILTIKYHPSDYFRREGDDIYAVEHIDFLTAILGGALNVMTIHGKRNTKVPSATQPDAFIKLTGEGIQRENASKKGDHYVHIKLKIPSHISPRQKEILEQFNTIPNTDETIPEEK